MVVISCAVRSEDVGLTEAPVLRGLAYDTGLRHTHLFDGRKDVRNGGGEEVWEGM